jgi:hypothetical protein
VCGQLAHARGVARGAADQPVEDEAVERRVSGGARLGQSREVAALGALAQPPAPDLFGTFFGSLVVLRGRVEEPARADACRKFGGAVSR